jgi:CBS domain-containing protein
MAMNAIVKDVMSTHVVAVRKGASLMEIAARLREHRVSAFPVLDDDDKVIDKDEWITVTWIIQDS